MNERIQELAEQAGASRRAGVGGLVFRDAELKKFAELIVRECADIAKHHVMNISTYADAEFVEEQIGKHFGVEE
jgi:hypothetical protein